MNGLSFWFNILLPSSLSMRNIINLRTARKRAARHRDAQHAAEQRALHGQTKAERLELNARRDKARRDLDQHRIHKGDES